MKRLIFACAVLLASCSVNRTMTRTKVTIRPFGDVDGRKTYNVYFPNGRVIEQMYAEEVMSGISTGVWQYNEDLK